MEEKQERFLKGYFILVFGAFLNYGIKFVFSGNVGDAFWDSLIFFIIGNFLVVYLYRNPERLSNNTTQ